jgi:hypothetical protein
MRFNVGEEVVLNSEASCDFRGIIGRVRRYEHAAGRRRWDVMIKRPDGSELTVPESWLESWHADCKRPGDASEYMTGSLRGTVFASTCKPRELQPGDVCSVRDILGETSKVRLLCKSVKLEDWCWWNCRTDEGKEVVIAGRNLTYLGWQMHPLTDEQKAAMKPKSVKYPFHDGDIVRVVHNNVVQNGLLGRVVSIQDGYTTVRSPVAGVRAYINSSLELVERNNEITGNGMKPESYKPRNPVYRWRRELPWDPEGDDGL